MGLLLCRQVPMLFVNGAMTLPAAEANRSSEAMRARELLVPALGKF